MIDPLSDSEARGIETFEIGALRDLYRPLRSGDWELRVVEFALGRGYWSPTMMAHNVVLLMRGKDTWMSLMPVECESQILGVEAAHGHVVIMGLGMGWVAAETALRSEVTQVTIIERDPDVIALHEELELFARLPDGAGEKVRIIHADALEWQADIPVDLLMPDIWLPLIGEDRLPDVRRMQNNCRATAIYFWGQELEIARHAAAVGRQIDEAGVAATIDDFRLPVIIPETDDYPGKIRAAARQWMNGRWFKPEHAAFAEELSATA